MRMRTRDDWNNKAMGLFLPVFFSLAGTTLASSASEPAAAYSAGGWSTLHQGPANRRSVDTRILTREYTRWQAAEGASVLTAPVTSPDGQRIYFTTGLTRGNSNLHAYTLSGTPLWHSEPWSSAQEGDWVAAGNHPVNALTTAAFTADGHLLGVTNFGDVLIIPMARLSVVSAMH